MRKTFLNPFKGEGRPEELGYLFVVGGPGAVGTTTIARAVAEHFKLGFIYSGKLMRNIAKEKGFETLEMFLESDYFKKNGDKIDHDIDMRMVKASMQPDVLIDSKNFAAFSSSQKIPCTVKIWLDASIETRVTRFLSSREGLSDSDRLDISRETFEQTRKKLETRYRIDEERFERLYGIEYDKPELYNDIVLDTSGIDEAQTFNLILSRIENGGYLKEESDSTEEI